MARNISPSSSSAGLLRGDMKSRYDAYAIGRNWGWLNPNDICNFEGMNPIDEEKGGNEYLRPLNMVPAGTVYVPPMATDAPDPLDKPGSIPGNDKPQEDPPPDTPDDEGTDASQKRQLLRRICHRGGAARGAQRSDRASQDARTLCEAVRSRGICERSPGLLRFAC